MSSQKIFAIGDIHGCAQELSELINKLPLEQNSKIIFLGDYIDRGPNSKDVIDQILNLKKKYEVVTLMGNHEAMLLAFLQDPSSSMAGFFILNGGSATLASYIHQDNQYVIPEDHLDFFNSLAIYHETNNYLFVHAGVPNIPLSQININEHKHDLLWIRESFLNSSFRWDKMIVHGHTPQKSPEKTNYRINLDTGCVFNGALTALELPSGVFHQVKAQKQIPVTYLKENPESSRVAKRFLGEIPVFVETPGGYDLFTTINYNEFGLLIVDTKSQDPIFTVNQVIRGKIGSLSEVQIQFVGEVVRLQKKGLHMCYGIKMLEPLKS